MWNYSSLSFSFFFMVLVENLLFQTSNELLIMAENVEHQFGVETMWQVQAGYYLSALHRVAGGTLSAVNVWTKAQL